MEFFNVLDEIKKLPFLRIIVPFIVGIILALGIMTRICDLWFVLSMVCALSLVLFSFFGLKNQYSWLWGLFANGLFLLAGMGFASKDIAKMQANKDVLNATVLQVLVDEPFVDIGKYSKTSVRVISYKSDVWHECDARILMYLPDSLSVMDLGSELLVQGTPRPFENSGNPYAFSFSEYNYFKGITAQIFVKSSNIVRCRNWDSFSLKIFAYRFREKLLKIYRRGVRNQDDYSVLSALVLGYSGELSSEIKASYSATGAMHVLSVSGLHVGIIFGFLSVLFFYKNDTSKYKIFKGIAIILVLWFYALIAGLSPPVLRSTIMFSFLCLGKALGRNAQPINTLSLSAFVILIFDPFQIYDVGFQLSYLAVLGILLFYNGLYSVFATGNYYTDKLWSLTCVSLAAQITTFPVCFYYFSQFPNYFFISNLVVIPLSGIILGLGVGVLFVSPIGVVYSVVSQLLSWFLHALNVSVAFIEQLPFAVAKNMDITFWQTIVLYLIIIVVVFFVIRNNIKYLRYALVLLILLASNWVYTEINLVNDSLLVVYNIRGQSVYNISEQTKNWVFLDENKTDKKTLNYAAGAFWMKNKLSKPTIVDLKNENNVMQNSPTQTVVEGIRISLVCNELIVFLRNDSFAKYFACNVLKCNYLVISDSVECPLSKVLSFLKPEKIIFDSSVKKVKLEKWKQECISFGVPYFAVSQQGAFVTRLN